MVDATFASSERKRAARVFRRTFFVRVLTMAVALCGAAAIAQQNSTAGSGGACAGDDGGLTLPPGFCATVFADKLGHARQMTFAPNGVLYVNTWSGRYYRNAPPPPGGFLIALQDSKGVGRADRIERFGPDIAHGSAGGTGIRVYGNALYAEQNDKIIRY